MAATTTANLICPICNGKQTAEMPTDACQFFYDCQKCGKVIRPKPGDCCVFCSYADVVCPTRQRNAG